MKIEIFDEKKVIEKEPVRLKLIMSPWKLYDAHLISVDKNGMRLDNSTILVIKSDGTLLRSSWCKVNGIIVGGYHTPAEFCKELVISKDGVTLKLNGSELSQIYNLIRPNGTSPRMNDPAQYDLC